MRSRFSAITTERFVYQAVIFFFIKFTTEQKTFDDAKNTYKTLFFLSKITEKESINDISLYLYNQKLVL